MALGEKTIVRRLVQELNGSGFHPSRVWDGGEWVATPTTAKVVEYVFSVDDATATFRRTPAFGLSNDSTTYWIRLIPGNEEDIITDWSEFESDHGREFTSAINRVIDSLDDI